MKSTAALKAELEKHHYWMRQDADVGYVCFHICQVKLSNYPYNQGGVRVTATVVDMDQTWNSTTIFIRTDHSFRPITRGQYRFFHNLVK